jgi:hypothetical protein
MPRQCGPGVCLTRSPCTSKQCKLPVGPTVDSAADMMASAVMARAGYGLFPTVQIGQKGVKITRPGFYNVNRSRNYTAWSNATLCCHPGQTA